ncbi:hypothetical protein [Vagococcus carniphilus]|uniref:hypothetical protein n=1 Tax=Vagococcus carniphilus TaxID=218144 RepID=UPI0028914CA8|nr:hypothetical protein [Vagococcus carniphilus]MDT2866152.1 hypothetical protein [Vagococcus carniphilus]
MTTKKFKKFAKFLEVFLLLGSAMYTFVTGLLLVMYFFQDHSFSIALPVSGFGLFKATQNSPVKEDLLLAGLLVNIPVGLTYAIVFFKGSRFFKSLVQNQTPFSKDNQKLISRISIILMILGLAPSLVYSIILSFFMTNGYYMRLDIGVSFVVGAILYCVSEVINYGLELQQFSDDAV